MKPRQSEDEELPGQDSFLDIVANIVGILIILVTVVGAKAATMPIFGEAEQATSAEVSAEELKAIKEEKQAFEAAQQAIAEKTKARDELNSEVNRIAKEARTLAAKAASAEDEITTQDTERIQLLSSIIEAKKKLEKDRQALGSKKQEELELNQDLRQAEAKLDDLAKEQYMLDAAPRQVETIESLPTPLAKTVTGDEVHVRIKNGRVSVLPIAILTSYLKQSAEGNVSRMQNRDELTEIIGPVDGYRLRYRLSKKPYMVNTPAGEHNQGSVIQLDRWELLPNAENMGVSVEQALLQNADLKKALRGRAPDFTTITIWTYPDSFAEFRSLKKTLFELGYSAAARPLPQDIPIGGSPNGSKSSAQ